MNNDFVIDVEHLAKAYSEGSRPVEVLRDVTLRVRKGETVAILGASGSGKSTLLHAVGGLDAADAGTIRVAGTDIAGLSSSALGEMRNRELGFVYQFHHLLPEFTSLENVMIPALIAGKSEKTAKDEALKLLDTMGLAERTSHKPSELSGGEQQRVAIARALVNRPSVLFADEPSGNLDSVTKSEIHNLFFRLRDELGQTIVIVTHDPELAKMCDRSLFMKDGQFIAAE